MAGLANPRKNFRFVLELNGANAFLIQSVMPPTVENAVIKHGAPVNIPDGKTPGKQIVGDMVVKKLCPALQADVWVWDWMAFGLAGVKKDFCKTGFLKHLGPDGFSTIQSWFLGDVWPSKVEPSELATISPGENIIETVTFQVQTYVPKDSPAFLAILGGSAARAGGLAFLAGFENG